MENIKHLLNLDKQRFIMVGGLQGAGKSTTVDAFEKVGYKVVCPDRIRVELAKKANGNEDKLEGELIDVLQKYSMIAWQIAEKRVKEYLTKGDSVIFDAVNSNIKDRKQFIKWSQKTGVPVTAVYVECPLELAKERNIKRSKTITGTSKLTGEPVYGRYVPAHIIELKWISQILPTTQEGFNEVYILHQGLDKKPFEDAYVHIIFNDWKNSTMLENDLENAYKSGFLADFLPSLAKCWNINQETKWHHLLLHKHMIEVAKQFQQEPFEEFVAALLHDVGKAEVKKKYGKMVIDSKIFKIKDKVELRPSSDSRFIIARQLTTAGDFEELITEKFVERDPNAHFYEHEKVGAIIARRELISLGFDEDFAHRIYQYILYHMDLPYENYNENSLQKFLDKTGKDVFKVMIKMKRADRYASANDDNVKYADNFKKVKEFIERE